MITGTQNPVVGKDEIFQFSDGLDLFNSSNATYVWNIWKKKAGTWINITQKPPKMGKKISFKFGEKVLGEEFKLQVFKATPKLFSEEFETKSVGEFFLVPTSSKVPKIDKVILFNQGAKDPNKASYRDTLTARAYCVAMFNNEVEFQLWEDDAAGPGHNASINKNNQLPQTFKGRVNENGTAEVKISLLSNASILKAIANKYMMSGDKDEGANHEYYVTASYAGKIQKASQVNVDVTNPDHQAKPKDDSAKFPATDDSKTKSQPDPKGNIKDAYFVNDKNQKLTSALVDTHVKVQILSSNLIGKYIQYVVWEKDFGIHDEIFRSGKIKVPSDICTTGGFKITESHFQKGIDLSAGDPDSDKQNYFLEIIVLDSTAESKKFGLDDKAPQQMEVVRSASQVKAADNKKTDSTCICKEQYKDLIWGENVSCGFRKKVVEISKNLGLPQEKLEGANWLMAVMALETGRSFDPTVGTFKSNKDDSRKGGYVGLIQFGKDASIDLGIKRTELIKLTAEKQLDYVQKHFLQKRFKGELNTKTDLYLAVNYPNASGHGKEKNYVVYDSTKAAYDDNPMFKREADEYYFDKKGKKQYYNGKEGKSFVWEFEEAINDFYDEGQGVKATKFVCQNVQISKILEKNITSYHIYSDGIIEKHVPKVIKDGYEKKYKYIYHDKSGKKHEICLVEWHTTKEKGVGQVYKTKPTHSKILSDKIVSEGNTSRRIKYENGDIAEYGIHPKKGLIWLLYSAGKNDVELVKMPDSLSYKEGEVLIAYTFTSTERRFTGANSFAGFIGFLARSGYKLKTSGSCFSEGSSFPSQEHCNGRSVDSLYLGSVEQDQKVIDSAIFFHFTELLTGTNKYCKKLKNAGNGGSLHNSHLHSGNFKNSSVKIINEK